MLRVLVAAAFFASAAAAQDAPKNALRDAPKDTLRDELRESLTSVPGDPVRGRAIVANRTLGLCLLCHSGPIPEERFQGDLATDLRGAGRRWSIGQLRLRMVDPSRLNPDTIMPSYRRTEGLQRVAPTLRGRPLLGDQQIEDVLAYLAGLND